MGLFTSITDSIGLTSYGQAEAQMRQAMGRFAGLTPPELKALGLESIGEMSPEQLQTFLVENTAFDDIYVDPRLKQNQMDTLEGLKEIKERGMTATDRAMLEKIRSEEATQQRGAREAILQDAQARGIAGSGLELASQMQNQQGSATRQSARDLEVAALAQQRKDQALMQMGQLSGQMRDQEFGEQAKTAEARDLINKFNTANKQSVEAQNVGARNNAQAYNLSNAQNLDNMNKQWAAGIPQQQYQNALGLAGAQAGANYQMANMYNQQSAANMNMAGAAAMAYAMSDETEKKDIEKADLDIDEFLNEMTGIKFSYKNPEKEGAGEGQRYGVKAQDVAKSDLGKEMVVVNEEGKMMIDEKRALSALLGTAARLNERINNLENKNVKK